MQKRILCTALAAVLCILLFPAVLALAEDMNPAPFLALSEVRAVYGIVGHAAVPLDDPGEFVALCGTLMAQPVSEPETPSASRRQYVVERSDSGRSTLLYTLYDDSLLRVGDDWYSVRPQMHEALLQLAVPTATQGYIGNLFANRMHVKALRYQQHRPGSAPGVYSRDHTLTIDYDYHRDEAYNLLRTLQVQVGETTEYLVQTDWQSQVGDYAYTIQFDSGLQYILVIRGKYLYLGSTHMRSGLRFTLLNEGADAAALYNEMDAMMDPGYFVPQGTENPAMGGP